MKRTRVFFCLILTVGGTTRVGADDVMNLAGSWSFELDHDDVGIVHKWFTRDLGDSITLPGTTDQAGKGHALNRETMTYSKDMEYSKFPAVRKPPEVHKRGFLVREHYFIGRAWYQRHVEVPAAWRGKQIRLKLERVIWQSQVWIDDREVGTCDSLAAPHVYELGELSCGAHQLTIAVDNRMIHNTGTIGHAYGPETQTRWNGVVGEISLEALPLVWIDDVQVYPDAAKRQARVRVRIGNATGREVRGKLAIQVESSAGVSQNRTDRSYRTDQAEQTVEVLLPLEGAALWTEFSPRLLTLTASLDGAHTREVRFGLRDIRREGKKILVNGRRVFLRGTLDCCVYPRSGHPPVTEQEWTRVLSTIKAYGFNHVRFHSWCPPEAAFAAASRLGIYLAPETMFWVDEWTLNTYSKPKALGHDRKVFDFIRREIRLISDTYGNYPSFAMFCIGNEFSSRSTDWKAVNGLIHEAKLYDPRRLYNATTARARVPADDFWVTHNTGKRTRGVGPPHTDWDFAAAAAATDLPVLAHETGQRPVFPNYEHFLPKFTGPLKPYNYERLYGELKSAGLEKQVEDFVRASAKFQILQYKAEHEGMLRTADFAGYQLLMLNDFTGQSEALVGILDPFWESKGVVNTKDVRQWNSPTVPLARFSTHTWAAGETLRAQVEIAHYGSDDLKNAVVKWRLARREGSPIAVGVFPAKRFPTGALTKVGTVEVPLTRFGEAAALTLNVQIGDAVNRWSHWVYPTSSDPEPEDVHITRKLDKAAMSKLEAGGRVLLLAHGLSKPDTARTDFHSVFWSAGWWGNRFSSLGILCDPEHPALSGFPNDGHSDWQWQTLTQGATTFDLTETCAGLSPIVQCVTDFHHNRRLAQIFEVLAGKGRLLVCGYDLRSNLTRRHAARTLRASILAYAASDAFQPTYALPRDRAQELFGSSVMDTLEAKVVHVSSEAKGYEGARAIDGRPDTMWHTPWTGRVPGFPHELVVRFARRVPMKGARLLPRQDGNRNGWIKDVEILLSDDGENWSDPVASVSLDATANPKTIRFQHAGTNQGLSARYLKLRAISCFDTQPFASLAELTVIKGGSG